MPSRAILHDDFKGHIQSLIDQAAANAKVASGEQRKWAEPPPADGWEGSPIDQAGLVKAFNRDGIGQNYEEVIADADNPGTTFDCMALKRQNDYIAMRERAYRIRHSTSVRCEIHAIARRTGQGNPAGVFGNSVLRYVQDLLRQGGSS